MVTAWTFIDLQGKHANGGYVSGNHLGNRETLPAPVMQLQAGFYVRDADALPFQVLPKRSRNTTRIANRYAQLVSFDGSLDGNGSSSEGPRDSVNIGVFNNGLKNHRGYEGIPRLRRD